MTDTEQPSQWAVNRVIDRAIDRIMGVEIEAMNGDNLAVVLCSHFDCDDGSEPDDNGWSQAATDAYDEIKQEIAGLFVPVREEIALIQRAFAEREAELVGALNLARPILASTAPRKGVISEGKIVTAGQAFDAVMDALKSREAGHG